MKCKNCIYWGTPIPFPENNIDVRCCTHIMVCRPSYGTEPMTSNGVLTCDEGGMTDELMTGPDFGCIHFQNK